MTEHKEETTTYGAGRFVIDIPVVMQFSGGYSIRTREAVELVWPEGDSNQHALTAWRVHLDSINKIEPPEIRERTIVEEKELTGIGQWCKAVLYYHEPFDPDRVALDLLVNYGQRGLWIKSRDKRISAKEIIYEISTEQARAYRPPSENEDRVAVLPDKDSFYLRYGAIDLPFEYDESVRLRFKGHPLDDALTLRVISLVVDKDEKIGLLERAADAINKRLAPDLRLEKIRGRRLTVAGLKGEELVERATDVDGTKEVSFTWMCLGKKDNAHHPRIILEMVSGDDNLEEKLALWDAVLDSMRPAGR